MQQSWKNLKLRCLWFGECWGITSAPIRRENSMTQCVGFPKAYKLSLSRKIKYVNNMKTWSEMFTTIISLAVKSVAQFASEEKIFQQKSWDRNFCSTSMKFNYVLANKGFAIWELFHGYNNALEQINLKSFAATSHSTLADSSSKCASVVNFSTAKISF